jgi:NADH-quinone oxidoreductase subunit N
VALGGLAWEWQPLLWGVAILTMVVGSVVALTQQDVKRMLAYSSIAHAGFVLVGLVATDSATKDGEILGVSSVLFYLLAYGFSTIGAFAVVTLVRDSAGEATHLSQWAGLAKRSPLTAVVFTFFLAAFAGIPLTSGFTAKFAVFRAAWTGGAWELVVVGVVMSAVAAFFYFRVVVGARRPDRRGAQPSDDGEHRAQCRRDAPAGCLARAGARPGRPRVAVRPLGGGEPCPLTVASSLPRPTRP